MHRVLELQQGLADLTLRVDTVKNENGQLREENAVLKDYIDNLMSKVGHMTNLGTTAPSMALVQPANPESAQCVLVSEHIGELTAPAIDD